MVGSKQVFFMDEISTGLDSSTTYAIVKFLRDQTHALNYTTMISLLQPAPESYDLFDDILLMAEGGTSPPGCSSVANRTAACRLIGLFCNVFAALLRITLPFLCIVFVCVCSFMLRRAICSSYNRVQCDPWVAPHSLPAHVRLHMTAVVAQEC